jgi:hypothetical protein
LPGWLGWTSTKRVGSRAGSAGKGALVGMVCRKW